MTTDFDEPRGSTDEDVTTMARLPEGQGPSTPPPVIDEDELAAADSFDLPGADLSSEEISVEILPAQADEFTCASCFLVRHRSQIVLEQNGLLYCVDCRG